MHSILFILLVTLFIWLRTKDRLFTAAGFAAILSHSYLDYATSWKMRPLYRSAPNHPSWGQSTFSILLQTYCPCCRFLSCL
ncbi:metal-dependent hydrolase [Methanosarcina horonobensis]|uniref:hypothetical protein n=1 Tax=Methanosarcina horonobensis TaxID=418008 RepID=UPI0022B89B67|nr:hypothetical protein [Methanosarcina horonobensis]